MEIKKELSVPMSTDDFDGNGLLPLTRFNYKIL